MGRRKLGAKRRARSRSSTPPPVRVSESDFRAMFREVFSEFPWASAEDVYQALKSTNPPFEDHDATRRKLRNIEERRAALGLSGKELLNWFQLEPLSPQDKEQEQSKEFSSGLDQDADRNSAHKPIVIDDEDEAGDAQEHQPHPPVSVRKQSPLPRTVPPSPSPPAPIAPEASDTKASLLPLPPPSPPTQPPHVSSSETSNFLPRAPPPKPLVRTPLRPSDRPFVGRKGNLATSAGTSQPTLENYYQPYVPLTNTNGGRDPPHVRRQMNPMHQQELERMQAVKQSQVAASTARETASRRAPVRPGGSLANGCTFLPTSMTLTQVDSDTIPDSEEESETERKHGREIGKTANSGGTMGTQMEAHRPLDASPWFRMKTRTKEEGQGGTKTGSLHPPFRFETPSPLQKTPLEDSPFPHCKTSETMKELGKTKKTVKEKGRREREELEGELGRTAQEPRSRQRSESFVRAESEERNGKGKKMETQDQGRLASMEIVIPVTNEEKVRKEQMQDVQDVRAASPQEVRSATETEREVDNNPDEEVTSSGRAVEERRRRRKRKPESYHEDIEEVDHAEDDVVEIATVKAPAKRGRPRKGSVKRAKR
ncbi:hypothetical protein BDZ91DRAFT_785848 [Kalaharituber pfeilii]|nr:hypothetical protein BDZ91DRAFT_785848 [Kalaharituber pfeilii]